MHPFGKFPFPSAKILAISKFFHKLTILARRFNLEMHKMFYPGNLLSGANGTVVNYHKKKKIPVKWNVFDFYVQFVKHRSTRTNNTLLCAYSETKHIQHERRLRSLLSKLPEMLSIPIFSYQNTLSDAENHRRWPRYAKKFKFN